MTGASGAASATGDDRVEINVCGLVHDVSADPAS